MRGFIGVWGELCPHGVGRKCFQVIELNKCDGLGIVKGWKAIGYALNGAKEYAIVSG